MLGVFAWRVLQRASDIRRGVLLLAAGGGVLLLIGWLWSWHLPIVKNRWTSSYVLWCGGLSWLLLAVFYAVLDGLRWRRWAGLFLVLGGNSILAYLISTVFMAPFRSLAGTLFGGWSLWLPEQVHAVLLVLAAYGAAWGLLAWLYRQKLFLRL